MILSFSLENCRIFKGDDNVLSCHTISKSENTRYALAQHNNLLINKYTCIWGASSSGKSIMLAAMHAVVEFVANAKADTGNVKRNLLCVLAPHMGKEDEAVSATLTFLAQGKKCEYKVVCLGDTILSETLRIQKSRKYSTVVKNEFDVTVSSVFTESQNGNEDAKLFVDELSKCKTLTQLSLPTNDEVVQRNLDTLKNDAELLSMISRAFKDSDFGVDEIILEGDTVTALVPFGDPVQHAKMTLEELGGGALRLFNLLLVICPVLRDGGVAIVDGFDDRLHPLLATHFLESFKFKEDSQLICSMRTVDAMNELNKQQVVFFDRLEDKSSDIYSLNDIQGVRNDDNFSAKYLAGVYGAIPNIG